MIASIRERFTLDHAGILVSFLCLIHCAAFPIAVALLPSLVEGHEVLHHVFLAFSIPIALLAFISGHRKHGSFKYGLIGSVGLVLLALSLVEFLAAGLVIWAHVWNHRHCKTHCEENGVCDDDCS